MRSRFDEQLALLNKELIEMGSLCEEVIALASQSLTEGDAALAARVSPLDAEIDRKEREIESLCLKLLLQQQPVARDLRQISAALKMITDMERIGDQAEDIADLIYFHVKNDRKFIYTECIFIIFIIIQFPNSTFQFFYSGHQAVICKFLLALFIQYRLDPFAQFSQNPCFIPEFFSGTSQSLHKAHIRLLNQIPEKNIL